MRLFLSVPSRAVLLALLAGRAGRPPQPRDPLAKTSAEGPSDRGALVHPRAPQRVADGIGVGRLARAAGYAAWVRSVANAVRAAGHHALGTPDSMSSERFADEPRGTPRGAIAPTRAGDPNDMVQIGVCPHPVPKTPGIAEDKSTVATSLEVAQRRALAAAENHVTRLTLFGSEEDDMQGSKGYTRSQSDADLRRILLYPNLHRVGPAIASPRPARLVRPRSRPCRVTNSGLAARMTRLVGDSGKGFVRAGVPTGGQTENVNWVALSHYLHAIGGTLVYFATFRNGLSPVRPRCSLARTRVTEPGPARFQPGGRR